MVVHAVSSAMYGFGAPEGEPSTTVCIANLPSTVEAVHFRLLFRFAKGVDKCLAPGGLPRIARAASFALPPFSLQRGCVGGIHVPPRCTVWGLEMVWEAVLFGRFFPRHPSFSKRHHFFSFSKKNAFELLCVRVSVSEEIVSKIAQNTHHNILVGV